MTSLSGNWKHPLQQLPEQERARDAQRSRQKPSCVLHRWGEEHVRLHFSCSTGQFPSPVPQLLLTHGSAMPRGKQRPLLGLLITRGLVGQCQTRPSGTTGAGKLILQLGAGGCAMRQDMGPSHSLEVSAPRREPVGQLVSGPGSARQYLLCLWVQGHCLPCHLTHTAAPGQGYCFLHKPLPWC